MHISAIYTYVTFKRRDLTLYFSGMNGTNWMQRRAEAERAGERMVFALLVAQIHCQHIKIGSGTDSTIRQIRYWCSHSISFLPREPGDFKYISHAKKVGVWRVCTIWFVEIHLQIIPAISISIWSLSHSLSSVTALGRWWQKNSILKDFRRNLVTWSQQSIAINSGLWIFIDILAPIYLMAFIVTDGHWNAQLGTPIHITAAWTLLGLCPALCVYIVKFIGYLFEYNYCIQITINFDCLTDSIKCAI